MTIAGDLWNVYHQVQLLLEQDPVLSQESKLTLDTNGYETCFRILNGGPFAERIAEKVDIPATLVMQVEKYSTFAHTHTHTYVYMLAVASV